MNSPSGQSSPAAQNMADAFLSVIEASLPTEVRKDFQGTAQPWDEKELPALEWTEHLGGGASQKLIHFGGIAETFLSLANVLGLERRAEGHKEAVLAQISRWVTQFLEVIRTETPSVPAPGDSTWVATAPAAGQFYRLDGSCGSIQLPFVIVFSPEFLKMVEDEKRLNTQNNSQRAAGQTIPIESLGLLYSLLDMELPVSIAFGRAEIPLGDVFQFGPGTVVELDRSTVDPVEVRVNNQVVARGEVVSIDGNYGVRIQEVVSTQDRLQLSGLQEPAGKRAAEAL